METTENYELTQYRLIRNTSHEDWRVWVFAHIVPFLLNITLLCLLLLNYGDSVKSMPLL